MATLGEWRDNLRKSLGAVSDAPALDADRLLLYVLGVQESSYLTTHDTEEISGELEKRLTDSLARRMQGEPLSYITGKAQFYGRDFLVTPEVLIPRPDTEQLLEAALEQIRRLFEAKGRKLRLADVGTGSGCLAITLALTCPDSIEHIYATDISAAALAVAQQNAEIYKVSSMITFLQGDMLAPLTDKAIDLIVSNPPYVPTAEFHREPTIETKGLLYEPIHALHGGIDGLTYVRELEASGIPAVIETVGAAIRTINIT